MQFKDYENEAIKTAEYPTVGEKFVYPTLGLVGEAGEVAEKIKKLFRNDDGVLTDAHREELKKELGDVLWYLAALSRELGFSLDDVAEANITKLRSRAQRGVIKSSGDNR
ncbi:MAG: nucleoside triphosphate pyrophosphohydrolase family protein [Candidatus Yonathbacteria bacterium]|nr:nucleoside triphosphate pyrophosphohydrolase family protein [Candidatus Yonathbacteria bacterium]